MTNIFLRLYHTLINKKIQVQNKGVGQDIVHSLCDRGQKKVPSLCDRERTITWLCNPRFHTQV